MSAIRRYCQALDLKDDPGLIAQYEKAHERIWPEVAESIRESGVVAMEIWRIGPRLFMIMDVDESHSFERAAALAERNPKNAEWEEAMWKYQVATPWAPPGGKWVLMERIFDLADQR
jgi:L-rhamnose mutarotase